MNDKWYIVVTIWFSWMFSFTFHDDMIPMTFGDQALEKPFLGGFNNPKIQWLDLDTDGDLDLFILDASGYLRYLENQGTASTPDFKFITASFQNVFCGDWFYFADYDFDGDLDLTAQNGNNPSHISYFQNSSSELAFMDVLSVVDGGYVVSSQFMTPTFADIDYDGDLDFFTGNMVGTLNYYENTGLSNGFPQFEFMTDSWQNIYIVSSTRTDDRHGAAAITFIDLNGNGVLDLSWGDYNQQSLYIIWNLGTPEDPYMDNINVTTEYPPEDPIFTTGQNMPTFADLDGDGDEDLYITVLFGAIGNQLVDNFYYYKNENSNSMPQYVYQTDSYFSNFDIYINSSPEFVDIDFDGDLDLFVSNEYNNTITLWPAQIHFFRNTGTSSNPNYVEETTSLLQLSADMGPMLTPEFGDLNGNGNMDLLVGNNNGFIQYYENTSSGSNLTFTFIEYVGSIDLSGNSVPTLGDLDGDGDLDMLIGQLNGSLVFYRNTGSASEYNFQEETFDDIQVQGNSAPELFDIEGDGDLDLVLGSADEELLLYLNQGSSRNFQFELDTSMFIPRMGMNNKPAMGNLYCGKLDIITGLSTGGLYHLQRDEDIALGDVNGDVGLNVQDVVTLANWILSDECYQLPLECCAADLNGDGGVNVVDILILVGCVLEDVPNCGG